MTINLKVPGASSVIKLYPKADGKLYAQDTANSEYDLMDGTGGGTPPTSTPFEDAVTALNPLLWYRFNTAATQAINEGSLSGMDSSSATSLTDSQTGALGADEGWDFDGSNSKVVISYNSALTTYTDFTIMTITKADTSGEGTGGRFFDWDDKILAANLPDGRIGWAVKRATTDSQWYTALSYLSYPTAFMMVFFTFTPTEGAQIFVGQSGTVAQPSSPSISDVGSGSITFPASGKNLIIGNVSGTSRTYDGIYDEFAYFPTRLTLTQMQDILDTTTI